MPRTPNPSAPLTLTAGMIIAIQERGRWMPYQTAPLHNGRLGVHGIYPEDIPAGTLIQPARWGAHGIEVKPVSPWAHQPQAPWRSGRPCDHRDGHAIAVTVSPALASLAPCDGSLDADTVIRIAPAQASEQFSALVAEIMARSGPGGASLSRMMGEPDVTAEEAARLHEASGIREIALCRACAQAVSPKAQRAAAVVPAGYVASWLSLRPEHTRAIANPRARQSR